VPLRVAINSWRDLDHPEAGGAERYIVRVAEGLAERGHEVTIRTARYPGSLARETHRGVHYIRSGGRLSIYPRALAAQLNPVGPADVVVDVQNGMPYLSPLVRRGPVVNLVHHAHREQWPYLFGPRTARAGWWAESRLAPLVYRGRHYVTVSGATRTELIAQGVAPELIHVIHNGTDPAPPNPPPRAPHANLVVLGRLVPQKRIELAIDTVADLRGRWPGLRLEVVGTGWWHDVLVERAQDRGVADVVTFHGHVSEQEKHDLLARAWVHLLPSVKEGWGLVVVEAGVHGTPTVAFRGAGGPNDSVLDGRTGVLVDDDLGSFTAAVARLLEDDAARERMGNAAQDWVSRFHWERAVESWERVLRNAATGRAQEPS
jgi:glycosyltransferase involved in cell wall biosynthesis